MTVSANNPKKRTGLTIGAWLAAVLGAIVVAAGGTAIWANTWERDGNGYLSANAHRYQTHTRAIATEGISVGSYVPTWLAGNVRLDVSGDKPLFVGIAPRPPWTPTLPASSTPKRPISTSIHSRSPTLTTRVRSTPAGP